jgi:hypothetical protein
MKTYQKTITKNKLEINYDSNSESPRAWSNFGFFTVVSSKYNSPDDNYVEVVKNTGEVAESLEHHIELIKKEINNVLLIVPVTMYEHTGVAFSLGVKHGFDYSHNGFYIVTKESYGEIMGDTPFDEEKVLDYIKGEIETFNKWLNGEVYSFDLYDENGEIEASCGGFYDVDDIKEHLPEGWANEEMSNYII